MIENLYDNFHTRVQELTGDPWCPYPSELMMQVVMKVNDDTAKKLILKRRQYLFPHFLAGDPMQEELMKLSME